MILSLSNKVTCFFVTHGIIKSEDKEVYSYSFQILFATVLNLLALCVLSIITGTVIETLLYLFAFVSLRQAAGGYHAKNHFRCFLLFMTAYAAFLSLIKFFPSQYIAIATLICVPLTLFLVFIFSPIDDPNKPFSENEIIKLKRKSRIVVVCLAMLAILVFILFSNKIWGFSILLGILSVALSLLASAVKKGGLVQ